MNKVEVIALLAKRMKASDEEAAIWLEAVLGVLHGSFAVDMEATAAAQPVSNVQRIQPEVVSGTNAPVLRSVTPTARLSIGDEIMLDRFPFRVGREGRSKSAMGKLDRKERAMGAQSNRNELYLKDFGKSVNVSREHFQIEVTRDGSYELVDRGSACGTIVASHVVGGNFAGGRWPLQFGDAIIVGTRDSALVFEFSRVGEGAE